MTKNENGENVRHLEVTEVALIRCNTVNNDYRHDSKILRTFIPNKLFGQLLDILPKNLYFCKVLIQNSHILKYGLLMKILSCWSYKKYSSRVIKLQKNDVLFIST